MPHPTEEWVKKYGKNWDKLKVQLKPHVPDMSAKDISISKDFIEACGKLGVKPTVRQARKYRAKVGKWSNKQ